MKNAFVDVFVTSPRPSTLMRPDALMHLSSIVFLMALGATAFAVGGSNRRLGIHLLGAAAAPLGNVKLVDKEPSKQGAKVGSSSWSCAVAGAVSCSVTHSLLLPLDAVKTRLQSQYKPSNPLPTTWRVVTDVAREGGLEALLWPTAMGYALQGAVKFGLYDHYKRRWAALLRIPTNSLGIGSLLLCSAVAETAASVALCPLEAVKILMISNPALAQQGALRCLQQILRSEGCRGLFRGLSWVLLRQVPYTCAKLAGYDFLCGVISSKLLIGKQQGSETMEAGPAVQVVSGMLAGALGAVLSQPADVVLSRVCSSNSQLSGRTALLQLLQSVGWKGCFAGLAQRAAMSSVLTALQFVLFERIGTALRTPSVDSFAP